MNPIILMSMMAFAALLGATGQIMLKKSSGVEFTIAGLLTNWPFFAFAILYGIAVIIQFFAYRLGGDVSVIYPVVSLSYVFAALFAWYFLGEHITVWTIIGITCIMIGLTFIGFGAINGGIK